MQEKKRNKYTGIAIILIIAIIVIAGLGMSGEDKIEKKKEKGFVTTSSSRQTETQSPGKFDDITQIEQGIEMTISYNDETVASTTAKKTTTTTTKPTTTDTATTQTMTTQATTAKEEKAEEYEYAYAGFSPVLANMDIAEWNLILFNRDYILPDGYKPNLSEAVKGSGVNLDKKVAPHYQMMYDAAKADGITLVPLSGYRRISRQKTNFENKIQSYIDKGYGRAEATQLAAQIILPPGTSEHNAGLAMDICSLDVSFENTKEFEWLCENAEDFGFILRYPKDKIDITRITYEPWHWRYVGVGHARVMNEKGLCLEEYLGTISL